MSLLMGVPGMPIEMAIGVNLHFSLGGETTPEALGAALTAAGSAVRPPRHSRPEEALRRAMDRLKNRRAMRRGLDGRRGHELVVEVEHVGASDVRGGGGVGVDGPALTYPESLRFRAVLGPDKRPVFSPPDHPAVSAVSADFDHFLAVVTADDLRDWLVTEILRLGAVHKVPRGNLYFVPSATVSEVVPLLEALAQVTASSFEVEPVARSEGALAWILRSIMREAEGLEAEIIGDVQRAAGKGRELGVRALTTRIDGVVALKTKLVEYEALLGQALPDISARLEGVRAALAQAVLLADAAADEMS